MKFLSSRMDVTTHRTTPQRTLRPVPSSSLVQLNGGVLCIVSSWRRSWRAIPNRWLSDSRHVGSARKTEGSPSPQGSGHDASVPDSASRDG